MREIQQLSVAFTPHSYQARPVPLVPLRGQDMRGSYRGSLGCEAGRGAPAPQTQGTFGEDAAGPSPSRRGLVLWKPLPQT